MEPSAATLTLYVSAEPKVCGTDTHGVEFLRWGVPMRGVCFALMFAAVVSIATGTAAAANYAQESLDRYFRIEYQVEASAARPVVSGYVYNMHPGLPVDRMQLAIEALERTKRLFDDLLLETLHERNHIALLGLGHLELRQGRCRVTEKDAPVALAYAHASMAERHIPAAVVHWVARARAEEVDQELLLTIDVVLPAMRPEASELPIGLEARQQIIRHRAIASYPPRRS
jgi:hypothetical protein